MIDDHTNETIQGNLKVSRNGGLLLLRTRTVTISLPLDRAGDLIAALQEVSGVTK
jgi:hypothetical protein